MTKPQQIQQRINEIIEPDVEKRLTFGCEIAYQGYEEAIYIIGKSARIIKQGNVIEVHNVEYLLDEFEILGKQPNLEMLLLALRKTNVVDLNLYSWGLEITIVNNTLSAIEWHLNQSLENQPEETINTIYKILNLE